jgi:PEP-CTERM motif
VGIGLGQNRFVSDVWGARDDNFDIKVLVMKIHRMYFVLAAVLVLALLASTAPAGVILATPAPQASGPGLGFATVAAVVTVQPNNDNVPDPQKLDNNIVVPLKRFDHADYIDLEFSVNPSDGVTEYQVSEFVDNNTGSDWSSYRMVLGYGTAAGFTISGVGDGLDFDSPDYDTPPTSGAFSNVDTSDEDILTFSGGTHGSAAVPYTFRIDVPDLRDHLTFTLRQIPTVVPEPGSLVLAVMAAAGLAFRRRG